MKSYLSLVKFSHTIFAMPFALIGFFLAIRQGYEFEPRLLLLVVLCMVTARNAAMAFNRWADRHIDSENARTAIREIPAGILAADSVLRFALLNALAFCVFAGLINQLCLLLSPLALLVIMGYSYTKRFTPLCHFVLGLGLGIVPVAAYIAVSAQFDLLPIFLGFAVLTWVSGFDIIYALQDDEFDREQGLYSIPSVLGRSKALQLSTLLHILSAAALFGSGLYADFGLWYWLGCALFAALLIYQHSLVSPKDLNRVNLAFFTTNGVASVAFMVFVLMEFFV